MDVQMEDLPTGQVRHVQISFFSKEKDVENIPDDIFDIPVTASADNLNNLVNRTIETIKDDWSEKRFEFLIGETFIRSTLAEFIDEYNVETENIIKIECILGLETPKPQYDLPAPDWVSSINITGNHLISTTYSGEITIWNKLGCQLLDTKRDKGSAYKCCSIVKEAVGGPKQLNGYQIVAGGENQLLTLFEIELGKMQPKTIFRGHERSIECVSVNADKTRLISGAFDAHLKIWNLEQDDKTTIFDKGTENEDNTKKRKENFVTKTPMVTLAGHKDAVVGVCWSTWNPAYAVSAGWDNSIIVWDLELAGEVSRIRGQKAFTSIDINNKTGLIISSTSDSVPRLYDPRSKDGMLVKQSFIGHSGWVSCVKWNPNDEKCFVSASFDKSVKVWDIRSAKTSLFDLYGHDDRVLCCAWGLDGIIASGSVDSTLKVFST